MSPMNSTPLNRRQAMTLALAAAGGAAVTQETDAAPSLPALSRTFRDGSVGPSDPLLVALMASTHAERWRSADSDGTATLLQEALVIAECFSGDELAEIVHSLIDNALSV